MQWVHSNLPIFLKNKPQFCSFAYLLEQSNTVNFVFWSYLRSGTQMNTRICKCLLLVNTNLLTWKLRTKFSGSNLCSRRLLRRHQIVHLFQQCRYAPTHTHTLLPLSPSLMLVNIPFNCRVWKMVTIWMNSTEPM